MEREDLQHGAHGEQELQVFVLHDDAAKHKLPKVGEGGPAREGGGVREHPGTDAEPGEGGTAEERGREGQAGKGPGAIDENELIDALGGKDLEPAREHAAVGGVHEAAGEADEGEGPRMCLEGGGDSVGDGTRDSTGAGGPALRVAPGEEVGVDERGRDGGDRRVGG